MLAKLGITVEHDPTDFDGMLDAATAGTFIINLHGISFSNYDAFGSINQFKSDQIPTAANGMQGQNNYRYNSPEMDKWIEAAQKATTATALKEAYSHIQDLFAEDLPCFYLEQRVYPDEVRKGLKGYDHFFSATVYNNWNIQYWYWWK
jgi:ABC-type transport system substrate-binding protein